MEEISDVEKGALDEMLKAMFAYEPAERPTVGDLLQSRWMREWGFPQLDTMGSLDSTQVSVVTMK
jgi:hypothetical protein